MSNSNIFRSLIKKLLKENQDLEEYFGESTGSVTISVNGEGQIKNKVIKDLIYNLRNTGGNIDLFVDGEEIKYKEIQLFPK